MNPDITEGAGAKWRTYVLDESETYIESSASLALGGGGPRRASTPIDNRERRWYVAPTSRIRQRAVVNERVSFRGFGINGGLFKEE